MCSLHLHFVRDKNVTKYTIDVGSFTAKIFEQRENIVETTGNKTGFNKEDTVYSPQVAISVDQQSHDGSKEGLAIISVSDAISTESTPCIESEDSSKEIQGKLEGTSYVELNSPQQLEYGDNYMDAEESDKHDTSRKDLHTLQLNADIVDKNTILWDHCYVDRQIVTEVKSKKKIQRDEPVLNKTKVPCDVCGRMYKKRDLKQHKRIHAEKKEFTCEICQMVFRTASCLYGHRLHHNTEKGHICQYCGKQFNNMPNLRQHIRSHTSERTLQCPLCPKMFRSNYVLKDHISRHSGEKPYICSVCNRSFKKAQELKRHTMTFHSEAREHVCNICQRRFKSKSNRVKHEKTHDKKGKS
ncbi:zinc finger and BTB domain-containing protein 14-like [Ruditapes philippinarum]|uniref:zinc finger and BTB domain-containing protein 14-like n=1 Tax=Ruditapes philippinarum TaxID=129788 RepID=UPI00295B38AA|nr:zinc finger and BTB domain-containing protein 14-like [Ruditapes philippinarum]